MKDDLQEICLIREEADGVACGKDVFTYLTTRYSFDSGERFNFSMGVCEDHHAALVDRYTHEFADIMVVDG